MGGVEDQLAEIDVEILRLYKHAATENTDELAALLDLAQIDELLERRHRLTERAALSG